MTMLRCGFCSKEVSDVTELMLKHSLDQCGPEDDAPAAERAGAILLDQFWEFQADHIQDLVERVASSTALLYEWHVEKVTEHADDPTKPSLLFHENMVTRLEGLAEKEIMRDLVRRLIYVYNFTPEEVTDAPHQDEA